MALEERILERVREWTRPPFDAQTIAEVQALLDAGDEKELQDRFYTELEFGTGGLRGLMGAGVNRMNRYTVARATQGLANYILRAADPARPFSVAVAYDSRLRSDEFSRETAGVLAANGIKTYLFEALRPTPELSFAVRFLGCTAGIVITASHNPKEYNGYKVYWSDGAQVVPPHDDGIIAEVQAIQDFGAVRSMGFEAARDAGLVEMIGARVDEAYLEAILPLSVQPDLCRRMGDRVRIVYTPLHGTGATLLPEALKRWGFRQVQLCEAQATPDGNFTNAPSPNPEEPQALALAIRDAEASGADLVLATDPDADRVGIAVRDGERFQLVTGNQIASLLVEYVLAARVQAGNLPADARVVKTIVTTDLINRIAGHYGVQVDTTLTGFKWIGEKIRQYEESGVGQYLVGGEESYGYLVGTHARDKDAIVSGCMIAEMLADSLSQGQNLLQRLDRLYRQYGIYQESQLSLKFAGAEGLQKIDRIMTAFRQDPPKELVGTPVCEVEDCQLDQVRDATGAVVRATGLPRSNVLVFRLADGSQVTARPSGTEPKIKFYFSVCDRAALPIGSDTELALRKQALAERHEAIRAAFTERVHAVAGA